MTPFLAVSALVKFSFLHERNNDRIEYDLMSCLCKGADRSGWKVWGTFYEH